MTNMQPAIILAAGRGERLVNGFSFPKPLKRVVGVPLIVRVLESLEAAGVKDAVVVSGYLSDVLISALNRYSFGLTIHHVVNSEWHKPNGNSVLAAKDFVTGPSLLMMCDHLWSPDLLQRVSRCPMLPTESVLGVDFNIDHCIDIPDATKVRLKGNRIGEISKDLATYDALDTGVFKITPALIDALLAVNGPEGCSLSQGVAQLAQQNKMLAVDVQNARWVDVDTPESFAHAERLVLQHGSALCKQRFPAVTAFAV